MINVLHLINIIGGGGTESYIYSLAKKLHKQKCRFFLAYSKEGPSLKLFEDLGMETIEIQMDGPFDLKAAQALKKICKDKSIDVVHTHFLRENYISILSKFLGNKVKLINTRHMLIKNSKAIATTNRFMTKFNDNIIAVSRAVEEILIEEKIDPKKISLIYTGIDCNNWFQGKNYNFRNEFNLDRNDLLIASVSRFTEEKGHFFLLNSIARIKEMIPPTKDMNYKFVLVGTGKLLEESQRIARELGISDSVIFTGYRADINRILRDCDLFISHSRSEAFGISILEALASGLAVVTTDGGGSREIIDHGSKAGKLVEYGDIDQMSQAIINLIIDKDLRNSYISNGLMMVKEKYSLDNTVNETYNLYSSQ